MRCEELFIKVLSRTVDAQQQELLKNSLPEGASVGRLATP
jgi:hypothetical protein